MKRLMIVVCLLLLPTSGVKACYEDHSPVQAGSTNRPGRPHYGSFAERFIATG